MTAGESLEQLRSYAEEFVRLVEAQTGEQLDFSVPSLTALDAILDQWRDFNAVYAGQEAESLEVWTLPIAGYLGEVLVRDAHGHWSAEPGRLPVVRLPDGRSIDVVERTRAVLRGLDRGGFTGVGESVSPNLR